MSTPWMRLQAVSSPALLVIPDGWVPFCAFVSVSPHFLQRCHGPALF